MRDLEDIVLVELSLESFTEHNENLPLISTHFKRFRRMTKEKDGDRFREIDELLKQKGI